MTKVVNGLWKSAICSRNLKISRTTISGNRLSNKSPGRSFQTSDFTRKLNHSPDPVSDQKLEGIFEISGLTKAVNGLSRSVTCSSNMKNSRTTIYGNRLSDKSPGRSIQTSDFTRKYNHSPDPVIEQILEGIFENTDLTRILHGPSRSLILS